MKPVKLFAFLAVSFFVGFSFIAPASVYAYQLATATFIPPSATPTSASYSCPVGTPAGWGTYTPSPLWELTCGNCSVVMSPTVSPSPSALPTWSLTGTPPVGCTPFPYNVTGLPPTGCEYAPTQTPTPLPTSTPSACGGFTVSFVSVNNVWGNAAGSLSCVPEGENYRCTGTFTGTDMHDTTDYPFTFVLRFTNYMGMYIIGHEDISLGQYGLFPNRDIQVTGNNQFGGWMNPLNGWSWSGNQNNYDMSFGIGTGGVSGTPQLVTVDLLFARSAACSILPTPSPIPTVMPDTGYCSSVAPTIDEFGFDLFVADGAPNCNMGWNEFVVGAYTVPAVQICLQPSQFGVIRLFGGDYEVGIYALAAAAAFLWRFLRTV
ncbi:MAG: hypothetical protein HY864_13390 [Chloroflexi bacterium]|nr:hypothetical protein [Chloroflexota bacterium]